MSPHAAESLRAILAFIMGDGPDGKVYLAEDAPPQLIVNIHRALELSAPADTRTASGEGNDNV